MDCFSDVVRVDLIIPEWAGCIPRVINNCSKGSNVQGGCTQSILSSVSSRGMGLVAVRSFASLCCTAFGIGFGRSAGAVFSFVHIGGSRLPLVLVVCGGFVSLVLRFGASCW